MFMLLAIALFWASSPTAAIFMLTILAGLMLTGALTNTKPSNSRRTSKNYRHNFASSNSARNARLQASHRHDYDTYYGLQDIGLIIDEPRYDGLHLRRVKDVSFDDEAVRPYIVLNLPPQEQNNPSLLRFEISDAAGQSQFIYEMDYYLRSGENAILPDYRLPLRGNQRLSRLGKWDLQVWVNGGLVGIHTFYANPSLEERRRQFGIDGEAQVRMELEADPMPLSLEELLTKQSRL